MYVVDSIIVRAEMEFLLFMSRETPEFSDEIRQAFMHILHNERFVDEEG